MKSPLATFPASNPFLFCTNPLAHFNFVSRTRFALSRHPPLTPLSTAFTTNFLLSPLSTAFTQITQGCTPLRKENERHTAQHHQRTATLNSLLPASLRKRLLPACRQANAENSASPATLSTFKMNTCTGVSKQRTFKSLQNEHLCKKRGRGPHDLNCDAGRCQRACVVL